MRLSFVLGCSLLCMGSVVSEADEPTHPSDAGLSPQAVEAITLMESSDPYQRQLGFLRLEALREPASAQTVRGYLEAKDPELRALSVRALAAIDGPAAIPAILPKLQHDPRPKVRREALLGLEPFWETAPELIPVFLHALEDRDTAVRMAAVDIVSRIDHPSAREALLMRNKRERRRDVRRVLKAAMKRLGG